MKKLRIGAQLYTLRGHTNTLESVSIAFDKLRSFGYSGVQVSALGAVDPADIAVLAENYELEIAATHFAWNDFLTDIDRLIDIHQIWDCRHAAIPSLPEDYMNEIGIDRFATQLTSIADRLNSVNIDFSYHNHSQELTRIGTRTWLSKLYSKLPASILKAELDVYWLVAGGADPIQWIHELSGRQSIIHFKDMTVLPDRSQRFAEVGEGNLNWPGILEACHAAGVEWAFIEQDDCYGEDPFSCLATSFRNLQSMDLF